MERLVFAIGLYAALICSALAQGGMGPGPGTVHSTGGGGTVVFDAKTAAYTSPGGGTGTSLSITNLTVGSGANRALVVPIIFDGSTIVPIGLACVWDAVGANQSLTQISGTNTGTNAVITGAGVTLGLIAPASGNKTLGCSWTGTSGAHAVAISFTGVNQGSVAAAFPNGNFLSRTVAAAGPLSITFTSATGHMVAANWGQDCTGWGAISGTTIATDVVTGPNIGVASNYDNGAATVAMSAAFTGSCVGLGTGTDVSP